MSQIYVNGEIKTRPGAYYRYSSDQMHTAGAIDGVAAIVMNAKWGPQESVETFETLSALAAAFGLDVANMLFLAGVTKVHAYRLKGSGGAKAHATVGGATVTAKYEGTGRALKIRIQPKLGESGVKQALILEEALLLEKLEFASGGDEVAALVEAAKGSQYITVAKTSEGTFETQEVALEGGKDPTVTAANYQIGFDALEGLGYNVLTTDSTDAAVGLLLKAYAQQAEAQGKQFIAVTGAATSVDFATRLQNAKALNDKNVVYFGSGWTLSSGETVDGAAAIAYAAGKIAATPSNESIVHEEISGATKLTESLTNAKYEEAIKNGLLLASVGSSGQIWFDSGITTLVTPSAKEDEGWKKIKRVKVRKELFDRIDRAVSPLVGKVNCDSDGIAAVIQSGMGVITSMISEKKLFEGAKIIIDPEKPYGADSAWFVIDAVDIDTLEKIYLHYSFKYSQTA